MTKSPPDIAQDLRDLSDTMLDRATDIRHFLGEDDSIKAWANQLVASSAVLMVWANKLEEK